VIKKEFVEKRERVECPMQLWRDLLILLCTSGNRRSSAKGKEGGLMILLYGGSQGGSQGIP